MNEAAKEISQIEPSMSPAPRREKARKSMPWLNQFLAVLAATASGVAWAFSVSGDLREIQQRQTTLEAQVSRTEVMVLQNRILTMQIAKQLAQKVDEALPGPDEGLPGIDFAIQQAQADLDRVKP